MDDVITLRSLQSERSFLPARTLVALAAVSALLSGIMIAFGL